MRVKETTNPKSRPSDQDDPLAFEILVRKLVAHAEHAARAPMLPTRTGGEDDQTSEDVLFACEVDGVRCVLARSHQPAADILSLSPREHEIARMIAKGHPNKIIASVLDISVWTVSTHLRRMFAKLGVTSRTAMVTKMFQLGKL